VSSACISLQIHESPEGPAPREGGAATEDPRTRQGTKRAAEYARAVAHRAQQADDAATRERHASAMHQHAFFQAPLEQNHAFRKEASSGSHQSASHAQRNKAIMKQVRSYH
jgi:hypothetical protein